MSESDIKKWIITAKTKYEFVKTLIEESKNDPPEEPYKSKYKSAEILNKLLTELYDFDNANSEISNTLSILSALFNYELGVISVETEELSNADSYLQKSWDCIKEDVYKPEYVSLAVNVLNQLGILWCGRNEPAKARDYLKEAELIYGHYKLDKRPCPLEFLDLFDLQEEQKSEKTDWTFLEKSLTLTLYYLAQVYEHLDENESSAKYCHITLKRQLDSKDYDPLDWAINCATLSQYFIAKDKFDAARHVLACASLTISEYKDTIENKDEEQWEHMTRGEADVARCWAKYALNLLNFSQNKRLEDEKIGHNNKQSESDIAFFRLMKESKVKEFENKISCSIVKNFEDARVVFLRGQEWLKEAKTYYILNNHTYDYVQIVQDHSKLFKFLALFEEDQDRQCKMLKRRIDLLEEVLEKLNQQYYLGLCRQLIFELAEIYSEIMDIKIFLVNEGNRSITPHSIKKINYLATKSITYYKRFIESLKDAKKELPETLTDDVVRPALIAHFCLGRLYSKIIIADHSKQMEYLNLSEESYKFVTKYIDKNPQHAKFVTQELPIIKEMVELIPAKRQALASDISL